MMNPSLAGIVENKIMSQNTANMVKCCNVIIVIAMVTKQSSVSHARPLAMKREPIILILICILLKVQTQNVILYTVI